MITPFRDDGNEPEQSGTLEPFPAGHGVSNKKCDSQDFMGQDQWWDLLVSNNVQPKKL